MYIGRRNGDYSPIEFRDCCIEGLTLKDVGQDWSIDLYYKGVLYKDLMNYTGGACLVLTNRTDWNNNALVEGNYIYKNIYFNTVYDLTGSDRLLFKYNTKHSVHTTIMNYVGVLPGIKKMYKGIFNIYGTICSKGEEELVITGNILKVRMMVNYFNTDYIEYVSVKNKDGKIVYGKTELMALSSKVSLINDSKNYFEAPKEMLGENSEFRIKYTGKQVTYGVQFGVMKKIG
ncbi:MAG: hypothetical protein ACYDEX_21960 [Mobilitalea sp.]